MESPTFSGEFRRGVNAFNLSVGFMTSLTTGVLSFYLLPDLFDLGLLTQALLAAMIMMFLTTGLHTAGHAYFGWRFERGIEAHNMGDHAKAVALLSVVEKKEMDHFDPAGFALRSLQASRAALS